MKSRIKSDKKQIKSKNRVSEHGEVFTNIREVNAMLDLVKDETLRIDSRFLEPACGDGNFLYEILNRKLQEVIRRYKKDEEEWEKNSLLAIMSCYGVELLNDNVKECINRLFKLWEAYYKKYCKNIYDENICNVANFILEKNILCGNALTMKRVDDRGLDLDEPIIFSEWSFVMGKKVKRRDFRFDELLKINTSTPDIMMFLKGWEYDEKIKEWIPEPIKEYEIIDYKKMISGGKY